MTKAFIVDVSIRTNQVRHKHFESWHFLVETQDKKWGKGKKANYVALKITSENINKW